MARRNHALACLVLLFGCGATPATEAEPARAQQAQPAEPRCGDPAAASEARADDARTSTAELARRHVARCGLREAMELTSELVRFPTVSSDLPASRPAFERMAEHLARFSAEAGLAFRVFGDHDAWIVELGEGEPRIAFVMHGDVVPAGEAPAGALPDGWSHPPFETTLAGDRIYGRGTEDDKGPIAAVLVVMRTLARVGHRPRGRIQAIIGTGEEHDWAGMERYVEREELARHVISIDASFPVVVAESGFVKWELALPLASSEQRGAGCLPVLEARGGEFLTQVPARASLRVGTPAGGGDARAALDKVAGPGLRVEGSAEGAELVAEGRGVHSSVAEQGDNALWRLSRAAASLPLCPGGAASALRLVAEQFAGDHWGQKLGIGYRHELMGRLLVVPTVLRLEGDRVRLAVNMRRPAGRDQAAFGRDLDALVARLRRRFPGLTELAGRYVGDAALADTSGALVPTLLDVYRELTGDRSSQPLSIRGGTYARLFPGAVSFGPALPGEPYTGHAPDEYITQGALRLVGRAALEAVLRLDEQP